jgi:hypothetical protein
MLWTINIKKIAFGFKNDKLFYSLGAAFGSIFGIFFFKIINKIL